MISESDGQGSVSNYDPESPNKRNLVLDSNYVRSVQNSSKQVGHHSSTSMVHYKHNSDVGFKSLLSGNLSRRATS
jgi:hypothetical protein